MVIWLFLLLILAAEGEAKYIAYIDRNENIIDAETFCAEKCSGNLLSVVDSRILDILQKLVPLETHMFVGYHTTLSNWLEMKGCFQYPASMMLTKMKTYNKVEYELLVKDIKSFPATCQLFCDPFRYFAKVNQSCICFSQEPERQFQVDSRKCYVNTIPFNNEDGFAFYFHAMSDRGNTDGKYCQQIRCSDGSKEIYNIPCYDSESSTSAAPRDLCVARNRSLYDGVIERVWERSFKKCLNAGLILPSNEDLSCQGFVISYYHWISQFKYQGLLSSKDHTLHSFSYDNHCGYVYRNLTTTSFKLLQCGSSTERSFVCEFDSFIGVDRRCNNTVIEIVTETTARYTTEEISTEHVETTEEISTEHVETTGVSFTAIQTTLDNVNVNNTAQMLQQTNNIGIIVGSVLGILLIVILIGLAVLGFLRSRKRKLRKANMKVDILSRNNLPNVTNVTSDRLHQMGSRSEKYEDPTVAEANVAESITENHYDSSDTVPKNSNDEEAYYNMPKNDYNSTSLYYSDLKEGEYDQLGNTRKHTKSTEEQTLYDHTITTVERGSGLYDHTVKQQDRYL